MHDGRSRLPKSRWSITIHLYIITTFNPIKINKLLIQLWILLQNLAKIFSYVLKVNVFSGFEFCEDLVEAFYLDGDV